MLLARVASERRPLFGEAGRNEKVKLLESMKLLTPEEGLNRTIRGQTDRVSQAKNSRLSQGELNVSPTATVETLRSHESGRRQPALGGRAFIAVPDKRMPRHSTEIVVCVSRGPAAFTVHRKTNPIRWDQPGSICTIQDRRKESRRARQDTGPSICTKRR